MIENLRHKIRRKWMKMRLQSIRVYCLHHVCAEYDGNSMYACDWMQVDEFKAKIKKLQADGVTFITLTDAHKHIEHDLFRVKKYAVITFDDGYASLKEILPWLEKEKIPAILFINGKYLDGKSYRENPKEKYLAKDDVWELISPLIEIGSHGWEHSAATEMTIDIFTESMTMNNNALRNHPRYVPFYAYTYGSHTIEEDNILHQNRLVPVLIDGADNYNNPMYIHRRLL